MNRLLQHPLVLNAVGYGVLYGAADVSRQCIKQVLTSSKVSLEDIDWPSVGRFMFFGTAAIGPSYFYIYGWLDRILPGRNTKTVLKKMLFDQTINSNVILFGFFTGMGMLEGKSVPVIKQEIKEKFVKTYVRGCLFWPPVQAINFFFLPPQFRTLYVGSAAFVWTNFLCYVKTTQLVEEQPSTPKDAAVS